MQITIVQSEIEDAIRGYVSDQGIDLSGKQLEVDLTAGRGSSGFTATIDITRGSAVAPAVAEEKTPEPTSEEEETSDSEEDAAEAPIIFE